jgi:outer membrane protein assembly factor BamA
LRLSLFCFFAVVLGLFHPTRGQEQPDSLIVREIIVLGNEKTREYVIRRELKTKIGQPLDYSLLEQDRKRIQNLQLFNKVVIEPVATGDGVALLVVVAERWYIFPYPILFYNERDVKKLSYGGGVVHQNFRGMATIIGLSAWFGFNPGFQLYYRNPYFNRDHELYTSFGLYSRKLKSLATNVERFDETHRGGTFGLGKRWGYHTFTTLTMGYRRISFPESFKEWSHSKDGVDHLPSLSLGLKYDNRDLIEYPKSGWFAEINVNKVHFPGEIDYTQLGFDLRVYIPLFFRSALAARVAYNRVNGDTPFYAKTYVGYSERIRGQFGLRRAGQQRALGSLELRIPIIPVTYFSLGGEGLLGDYSNNLPFGISAGIFYDGAALWTTQEMTEWNTLIEGYGLGIHFHLPYIQLLRVERAWDPLGHQQWIVDVGVWF